MRDVYSRHPRPLLRFKQDPDEIDLSGIDMTHYRLKKQREQTLDLREGHAIPVGGEMGSGTAREPEKEPLAVIIERLNEAFAGDGLTDQDKVNFTKTLADTVRDKLHVMAQIEQNTDDQVMLGDFPDAVEDAAMEAMEAQGALSPRFFEDAAVRKGVMRIVLELLRSSGISGPEIWQQNNQE